MSLLNPYDIYSQDEDSMSLQALTSKLFQYLLGSLLGMIFSALIWIGFFGVILSTIMWLISDDYFLKISSSIGIAIFSIGLLALLIFFLIQVFWNLRKKENPKWISHGFITSFILLLLSLITGLISIVYIVANLSTLLH